MGDRSVFRSLAEALRSAPERPCTPSAPSREEPTVLPMHDEEPALERLRVVEWFECARVRLLERFAEEVLARELLMGPPDIEALARRALELFAQEEPHAIRVAPTDAPSLDLPVVVRTDPALHAGDVVVEVREGRLESPLAFRARRIIAELSEKIS